jgi:hypothetical protein
MIINLDFLFLYVTLGILFNLFIDGLTWFLFKYGYLDIESDSHIPWDTRTKIMVTLTWPAVVLFLVWTVFINPPKTEDNE